MIKNRKGKWVSTFTILTLVFVLLIGCAKTGSNANSTNNAQSSSPTAAPADKATEKPKAAEKVTLTLLIDNQATLDGLKAVTDLIEKKFNIATTYDLRPNGAEGDNVVKTRLATNDMDDLNFYNTGSLFAAIHPEANFVDLSNEPFMANVTDSFKSTVSDKGKFYAIPSGSSMAGGWLYNKKVYAELGLSVPKTWAELIANSEKIKAAGKTAVIESFKDSWTAQIILLADYYNIQAQVPTFAADYTANKAKYATTPAALRSFEKLQEINKKGLMNKDFQATTLDAALKMLVDGTGVQYPQLTVQLDSIFAKYPDKINDIGVFPQPSDSAEINGYTVWMPSGISLNKNSKNIEAGKKWMEFFLSPEGIAALSTKSKANGPFVVKGAKLPDDAYPAVKDMLTFFDANKTAPALEFVSPIKGPNLPQISVEVGSGFKAPLDSAKDYDKDVEKTAKQLNLAGW
jgi:raffinose/stachyose/melibiose transport system substrate-binding protein